MPGALAGRSHPGSLKTYNIVATLSTVFSHRRNATVAADSGATTRPALFAGRLPQFRSSCPDPDLRSDTRDASTRR
jgi:hypothetical protein